MKAFFFIFSLNAAIDVFQKNNLFYPLKVKPEPISSGGGVHSSDKCNYWDISSLWHVLWFTSDWGCSFKCPPCAYSITTLVYIACLSVWGSCCRLSCYVFVCFGNGFQVAIVVYVTWWLMGKIHLLLTPLSFSLQKPSLYVFQDEHIVRGTSSILFSWQSDSLASGCFFGPTGRALKSRSRPLWKQGWICVWLGQCSLQREDWDYMRGRFGGPSIHRPCHPMGED